ncbi:MAG: hypothetical protein JW966_01720 [Anaerolineae bacterium]|nr:hypothetical protein [Anaerolineae bacterium]
MPVVFPRCPRCNARLSVSPDGDRLWCQFCGAERDDPDAQAVIAQIKADPNHQITDYNPPARLRDISPDQRRMLNDAWESIQQGDRKTAEFVLHNALKRFDYTADIWYLLALTADAPDEKHFFLDQALAEEPRHEYAWRDKGILDGVIPGGSGHAAATPDPSEPVAADAEAQICPLCHAPLGFDAARGMVVCGHCGFTPGQPRPVSFRGGYDRLENALLQRRFGFSKEWRIGQRVFVCENCHAQLTIPTTTLATQCPFCDSPQVLIRDAVGSFEEPDALLPFRIDRAAAAKAVHRRLPSDLRERIERGEVQGVYVPFWSFEGVVSVMLGLDENAGVLFRPGVYDIGDVLVGGVTQPSQAALYELMSYDLDRLVRYDRRYLGRWPAQIYRVDVVQASITGRAYLKYAARRLSTGYDLPGIELARTDSQVYRTPNTPLWQRARVEIERMNYRLLLLPVWMIRLILRDGTSRPAVVNGQTGEAIILASFRQPDLIIAGPNRPPVEDLPIQPLMQRRRNVIRPIKPPR